MDIRVISGAKSSEQNDDKTNNLDDVILCQLHRLHQSSIVLSIDKVARQAQR